MRLFGREVHWSQPLEQRDLAVVNDLGVAFLERMAEIVRGGETIPAVFRAIQFISDTVSALAMEEVEGGTVNSSPSRILTSPNPAETYQDTINAVVNSLLFRGNAYLIPRTFDELGFATSLIVPNPDEVKCQWDRNKIYPIYEWRDQPMEAGRDIIPIPLNRWPGRCDGVSPITACRLMLDGAFAEQRLATKLMVDDATPGGLIKFPEKIQVNEAESLRDVWEATHGGGSKRPAVLGGGADFQAMQFSPLDAQFLESRVFTVQEIARMFGVHGSVLLVPSGDSLTYSTTESLNRGQLTMLTSPTYLSRIEQAFTRLLPVGRAARFNTAELLIPDMAVRVEAVGAMIRAGFQADAALEAIGLAPVAHTGLLPVTLQRPEDVESVVDPVQNGRVSENV